MAKSPENNLNPKKLERRTTPLRVGLVLIAATPFILRACKMTYQANRTPMKLRLQYQLLGQNRKIHKKSKIHVSIETKAKIK